MSQDRSPIWIGLADLVLAILAVVIVAVNPPAKAGVQSIAQYLIFASWSNVDYDADVDLWLLPPPGDHPVYYSNRESGLSFLDQDCLGRINSKAVDANGHETFASTCKETIAIRGVVPGRYDVALNLYNARHNGIGALPNEGGQAVKVHVEIIKPNPIVQTIWTGDIQLDYVTETLNAVSFEMASDGSVALVSPPLTPITEAFKK